ncbi:hypothetical protein KQH62_01550 [bacterium]|nr:hypothetical protein [bacterium]
MASKKTEATEISLGFGLIGIKNPNTVIDNQIDQFFNHTLSIEKFREFLDSFNGDYSEVCKDMVAVGLMIRENHSYIATNTSIEWIGPENVMIATSLSKDLQMGPVAISAKARSDVVSNNSPYNLLIACPSGSAVLTRSENWFLYIARDEFQDYYSLFRKYCFPEYTDEVADFLINTSQDERKSLVKRIKGISRLHADEVKRKYLDMCHAVADKSAKIFNENYQKSAGSKSSKYVKMEIIKNFFRLDSSGYILAGIDKGEKIGLEFPDSNSWFKQYELLDVIAAPDLQAGQAVVNITLNFKEKIDKAEFTFPFHVQIRWSHGKLCGNPEGKLYKNFAWKDLPFVNNLLQ